MKIGDLIKPMIQKILPEYFRYNFCPTFITYSPRGEMLNKTMEYVRFSKMEGDYLEFGVYVGKSFVSAYHLAQHQGLKDMRFYAFDSFEGLPKLKGEDSEDVFSKGDYSCGVDRFKEILSSKEVDLNKVTTIAGWYDNTLNDEAKKHLKIKKAAVIWVDCDLYESTVPVLDFITDYVQDGTVLIFDDWYCFRGNPNKGEQKAFREWLEKNPSITANEYQKFHWSGNSFILNREAKE